MVSAMYDKIMGLNPKQRKTEIRHAYIVYMVLLHLIFFSLMTGR